MFVLYCYTYILIYSASNGCKCVSINSVQFKLTHWQQINNSHMKANRRNKLSYMQLFKTSSSAHAHQGWAPTLPRTCWVMLFAQIGSVFWGMGTDSATNLHRKAFDSCKLSVYIWLLGALPPDHHWGYAPGPRWGSSVPRTLCAHPDFRAWLHH